jgi:hypothetical protein
MNPPPTVLRPARVWEPNDRGGYDPTGATTVHDGRAHCHVEGCEWTQHDLAGSCGLLKLGTPLDGSPFMTVAQLRETPWWRCGAVRMVVCSGINRAPSPG